MLNTYIKIILSVQAIATALRYAFLILVLGELLSILRIGVSGSSIHCIDFYNQISNKVNKRMKEKENYTQPLAEVAISGVAFTVLQTLSLSGTGSIADYQPGDMPDM